ncbi:translation elongation factor Ts [Thermoleptolyngbya sp. C42_A2020_037]|uniref:translation elongation factor Ts n=1 Tax=Thermoleptolyngbya sp. C42_A2020_037 TaxID=2747799 RepID=UPI0019EBFF2B|nr:translation elongation factor Ts [Thermoleptolyngbya sp. C42_A2020_037]MBF2084032.1 translation elongation factor Ts [Thermoleptolyngbya sp. C42_A2020_037]
MAEISAKLVKELRDKTGAGMLDCKKALAESDGDIEKAVEWLRKRGITKAEKALSKTTAEGLVGSYIHTGGRVGVLVEVNCQTDFVARNESFQQLVRDVAMQIAASPNVEYVKVADIPEDVIAKEKEIEAGKDDLSNKPEAVRAKIVEGRIEKRLKELSLLDQSYIKDQSITVEEHIKNVIASLGENIQVRRFVRFVMGEGIEKEETDFAAEVAAQTGAKEEPKAEAQKEEPKTEAQKEEPKAEAKAEPKAAPKAEVKEEKKRKKK